MNTILFRSDTLIQLNGPVDSSTGAAVDTSPTTCIARLYDERKETRTAEFQTRLTLGADASATTLKIPKFTPSTVFGILDTILIELDDGNTEQRSVSGHLDTSNAGYDVITVGSGISYAASAGNLVFLKIKSSGASVFALERAGALAVGDQVEIYEDDGDLKVANISKLQAVSATEDSVNVLATAAKDQPVFFAVTLDSAFTGAVSSNARIRRKLGSDVSMTTSFGSFPTTDVVAGDSSWGFRGVIPDTQSDLVPGQDVRIEVTYDDGANKRLLTSMLAKVLEKTA